jgi:hypothetical protein
MMIEDGRTGYHQTRTGQVVYKDNRCMLNKNGLKSFTKPRRLNIWYNLLLKGMTYAELGQIMLDNKVPGFYERHDISEIVRVHIACCHHQFEAIGKVLGISADDAEEVFVPPMIRGIGDYWVGYFGTKIRDYIE